MGASSVTGVSGPGDAGAKAASVSNVNNVLYASSINDGETIDKNITVVFLNMDADYSLFLQDPATMVGRTVMFRIRNTNGHAVLLSPVYGSDYNLNDGWTFVTFISDGKEWNVCDWFTDD